MSRKSIKLLSRFKLIVIINLSIVILICLSCSKIEQKPSKLLIINNTTKDTVLVVDNAENYFIGTSLLGNTIRITDKESFKSIWAGNSEFYSIVKTK